MPMDFCSRSFLLLLLFLLLLMCPSSFSFQSHPASFSSSWQCLDDERVALLKLKDGFSIYHRNRSASKLDSWNSDADCCSWKGIECDGATGHVVELDLSSSWISGRIDSSLLRLVALQRLNLFHSYFAGNPIPSGLDQLTNLTHLNLSYSDFAGQVPLEISRLNKLVSLDLSKNFLLKFEKPNLTTFLQNMSGSLEELYLEWIDISTQGNEWGQAISSALPNLQKLSLSTCRLTGSVPLEIAGLANLVSLDLSWNWGLKLEKSDFTTLIKNLPNNLRELKIDGVNISQPGAKWGQAISSSLPNLRLLSLSNCQLSGPIDPSLLQLHFMSELDLSENNFSTEVPHFLSNFSYLTSLSLGDCGLFGRFPQIFFLLPRLLVLDVSDNPLLTIELPEFPQNSAFQSLILSGTRIPGKVPNSFSNLKYLKSLYLGNCNFHGPLPSWISNLTQLEELQLSNNNFSGPIPSSYGEKLQRLIRLNLQNNSLEGVVPSSLLSHPSLGYLDIGYNKLDGMHNNFSNGFSSVLEMIDLSNNKLHGPVPKVLFQLPKLTYLDISFNNFSGIQELQDLFQSLKNLNFTNSNDFSYQIGSLSLRSCNISEFPNILKYLTNLQELDLSNNKIYGEVPKWTWPLGNGTLSRLNLSNNFLESLEGPLPDIGFLDSLDLHSNNLQGSFPANINLNYTSYLFLSNNNFSGHIPLSICNAKYLEVLDLSNNHMSGPIPKCVEELSNSLVIISLQGNSFQGGLPLAFTENCTMRTFNLNGNRIEGPLPRSLVNCKSLEVLDLGNNLINDAFPHWLGILSEFRVLILRSNKFHGPIVQVQTNQSLFPMLQIIDLSSNGFTGNLPSEFFQILKAMRGVYGSQLMSQMQVLRYNFSDTVGYYQDTVTVTIKGLDMRLERILSLFISIDFSNNKFDGEIPESIGDLKLIYGLNFSRNGFSGHIPTSLASLKELESLDLSQNILSGEISWQLTRLTFLAVLNLSHNHLQGSIPQSNQFLTFSNDSFLENPGLCGPPLPRKCESNETPSPSSFAQANDKQTREVDGKFMWIGFGLGYGIGLGTFFWVLALSKKICREYMKLIDKMLGMVFH